MRPKQIKSDEDHNTIYRRIGELTKATKQLLRILEDEESISECGKKRINDLEREVY